MRAVAIILHALALLAASLPTIAAGGEDDYHFTYDGRLTSSTGKPYQGYVSLRVDYYHDAEGGSPIMSVSAGLESVRLTSGGLFQIRVSLTPEEYGKVFPGVSTPVYVEIVDLTHAAGRPLGRQQVTMLPYAGKIPVDGKTVSFGSDGKLTVGPPEAPHANQFLTKSAQGELVWATPNLISGAAVIAPSPATTSNTAGSDLTLAAGNGKGFGGSGAIYFQTAPGGLSGSQGNVLTTRLTIDARGNVGIGTVTPASRLHIHGTEGVDGIMFPDGTVQTTAAGSGSSKWGFDAGSLSSTSKVGIGTTAPLSKLDVNGGVAVGTYAGTDAAPTNGLIVSGNVGVGTTAPAEALDVNGSAYLTRSAADNFAGTLQFRKRGTAGDATSAVAGAGIELGYIAFNGWDGSAYGRGSYIISRSTEPFSATAHGSQLGFFTVANGSTLNIERMRIDQSGNVGIGTTAPTAPLQVVVPNGGATLVETSGFSSTESAYSIYQKRATFGYDGSRAAVVISDSNGAASTGKSLVFDSGGGERMRIGTTGNVGIGTTNPSSLLNLVGGDGSTVKIDTTSNAASNQAYFIANNRALFGWDTQKVIISDAGMTGGKNIGFVSNGAEVMRINTTGNVGIGTTSPSYMLHVNGAVAGVGAYNQLSDGRYKKDVEDLGASLAKILAVRGVSFKWIDENQYGNRAQIGVIAQEIEKVIPEVVDTGSDGVKRVKVSDLVPVMIEAFKQEHAEKNAEIARLRAEISRLKTDMDLELAELKTAFCATLAHPAICAE